MVLNIVSPWQLRCTEETMEVSLSFSLLSIETTLSHYVHSELCLCHYYHGTDTEYLLKHA